MQAFIDPLLIDFEHKRELTVFVKLNDQKDTLTLKKMDNGQYFIDYPIERDSEYATLEIQTKNEKTWWRNDEEAWRRNDEEEVI